MMDLVNIKQLLEKKKIHSLQWFYVAATSRALTFDFFLCV